MRESAPGGDTFAGSAFSDGDMGSSAEEIFLEGDAEAVVDADGDDEGHDAGGDTGYGKGGNEGDGGLAALGLEVTAGDEELEGHS